MSDKSEEQRKRLEDLERKRKRYRRQGDVEREKHMKRKMRELRESG